MNETMKKSLVPELHHYPIKTGGRKQKKAEERYERGEGICVSLSSSHYVCPPSGLHLISLPLFLILSHQIMTFPDVE